MRLIGSKLGFLLLFIGTSLPFAAQAQNQPDATERPADAGDETPAEVTPAGKTAKSDEKPADAPNDIVQAPRDPKTIIAQATANAAHVAQSNAQATNSGQALAIDVAARGKNTGERLAQLATEKRQKVAAAKLATVEKRVEDSSQGATTELHVEKKGEYSADVDVYGRFALHFRNDEGSLELRNNSSRFGFEPIIKIPQGVLRGRGEWRINFGEGDEDFNLDSGGVSSSFAVTTRLGFVGADLGAYGSVYFGKQWSVYYDVAGWTDAFVVFGGAASSVYVSGTDGGAFGTGRADNAATYRLPLGDLTLGIQSQFQQGAKDFADSIAASAVYAFPKGISVGAAYNQAFLPDSGPFYEAANGNPALSTILALRYKSDAIYLALLGNYSQNAEYINRDDTLFGFSTVGGEFYAEYIWPSGLALHGGLNAAYWTPTQDSDAFDAGLEILDFILGVKFRVTPTFFFLYSEARLDAADKDLEHPSAVTVGMRMDYSLIKFRETRK